MYNGVGLGTPRGSGTSGFIQKNEAYVRPNKAVPFNVENFGKIDRLQRRKHDDILEHEDKRKVELSIMQRRAELEDAGQSEADIEEALEFMRMQLMVVTVANRAKADARPHKSLENFAEAFGVSKDYKEGQAYDQEAQKQEQELKAQKREAMQRAYELRMQKIAEFEQQVAKEEKKKAKLAAMEVDGGDSSSSGSSSDSSSSSSSSDEDLPTKKIIRKIIGKRKS